MAAGVVVATLGHVGRNLEFWAPAGPEAVELQAKLRRFESDLPDRVRAIYPNLSREAGSER